MTIANFIKVFKNCVMNYRSQPSMTVIKMITSLFLNVAAVRYFKDAQYPTILELISIGNNLLNKYINRFTIETQKKVSNVAQVKIGRISESVNSINTKKTLATLPSPF